MTLRAVLLIALAGCGGGAKDDSPTDAQAGTCNVFITFDPIPAVAGPGNTVRAISHFSGINGLPGFHWRVRHGGADVVFMDAQFDHSEIEFAIPVAGTYDVELDLTASQLCPSAVEHLNVLPPGATTHSYRLRVHANGAPPQEQNIDVPNGTPMYAFGPYGLAAGHQIGAVVKAAGVGVPAYIRLAPTQFPDEIVETFADVNGNFSARILDATHDVIVIPAAPGLAPRRFTTDFAATAQLDLDAGTVVTGVVTGPSGAALAGAKVQLMIGDLPSSLATTAADGSFAVHAVPASGATITVDVTPPAASGLPRFDASGAIDLAHPLAIRYDANLAPHDLVGTQLARAGAPLANATITLVGTVSTAGTVDVNGTSTPAAGTIHVSATTNAAGVLPSLAAVPVALSAVIQVAGDDVAVVDLGSTVPAIIVAPPRLPVTSIVGDAQGPLGGVIVEAAPIGALALAGLQPMRTLSDASGQLALQLAAGGHYDLRFVDPRVRAAPLAQPDLTAATLPGAFTLAPATIVTGDVSINGLGAAPGALVQVLCKTCDGVDRTRPLAEVATDAAGQYHYAVANP